MRNFRTPFALSIGYWLCISSCSLFKHSSNQNQESSSIDSYCPWTVHDKLGAAVNTGSTVFTGQAIKSIRYFSPGAGYSMLEQRFMISESRICLSSWSDSNAQTNEYHRDLASNQVEELNQLLTLISRVELQPCSTPSRNLAIPTFAINYADSTQVSYIVDICSNDASPALDKLAVETFTSKLAQLVR